MSKLVRAVLAPNRRLADPLIARWFVRFDSPFHDFDAAFLFKTLAVAYAAKTSRIIHEQNKVTVSLTIRGKNGRIQEERTYGRDPARTPG